MKTICLLASLLAATADLLASDPNPARLNVALNNSHLSFSSDDRTNRALTLQRSFDLTTWEDFAEFDALISNYDSTPSGITGYFRAVEGPEDSALSMPYSNQLHPSHYWNFASTSFDQPRWAKFVIDLNNPDLVYFQKSALHYNFVTQYLPGFLGISPAAFEAATLYTNSQRLLLGTISVQPGANGGNELGLTFVGNQPYPVDFIADIFRRVMRRVNVPTNTSAFYFPEYEQLESARLQQESFRARGITVSSIDRWLLTDYTYSQGWAFGILKFFKTADIDAAYLSGALTSRDILLTDYVPAELPQVAGILSLYPSSPGSHVAILAQNAAIPFGFLSDQTLRDLAMSLTNREVIVQTRRLTRGKDIRIFEAGPAFDPIRENLLALKRTPPLQFPHKERGEFSKNADLLTENDARYFGGKASHYGTVRRALPTNSPAAIAISFNLWDDFMDSVSINGHTLRAEIASRLATIATSEDRASVSATLLGIQNLIKDATFPASLRPQVFTALSSFSRTNNIRFRSSTNVEDGDEFTGAGLYDSYSGCLEDDLDADQSGPCVCDPIEAKERGVFRAIQKVYASFYNLNAYLARREYSVNDADAGMALLVHHSFPDEIEFANGVGTLRINRFAGPSNYYYTYKLITQKGATSVANPDSSALPEIIEAGGLGSPGLTQTSSLVPAGARVMNPADYSTLNSLFYLVVAEYGNAHTNKTSFALDFEFKKTPTGLIIKQVRPFPIQSGPSSLTNIFLFPEPNQLATEQRTFGTLFANHFTKARLSLTARATPFDHPSLQTNIYSDFEITILDQTNLVHYKGAFEGLPGFTYTVQSNFITHQFRLSTNPTAPTFEITTQLPDLTTYTLTIDQTIRTVNDLPITLTVTYPQPRLVIVPQVQVTDVRKAVFETNRFTTLLARELSTNGRSVFVYRERYSTNSPITIRTEFYWDDRPKTFFGPGGYTAAMIQWKQTRIGGLTTEPFILTDPWAQSYKCYRKNMYEEFCFEPELDPNLPPQARAELRAANVRFISFYLTELALIGFDGTIRYYPVTGSGYPYFY